MLSAMACSINAPIRPTVMNKELRRSSTPCYYYDMDVLSRTLEALRKASADPSFRVHYAIKANSNPIVLDPIRQAGLGVDCVSGGEIKIAIENGFEPSSIVFAGVGKSDEEIEYALAVGIACFNVESLPELEAISETASRMGLVANVALRVNPDIDAHTHHYITTGLSENKFGIDMRMLDKAVDRAISLPGVSLKGLHFHIGSQITISEPFKLLCERINDLLDRFDARGIGFESINVGGGLGINYDDADEIPDFERYFRVFRENLKLREGQTLHFELGRAIVGQCGSLVTRVLYVKEGIGKKFVIVDAGMTDLIRPALYGAHHLIANVSNPTGEMEKYDVVGPVCESSDVFAQDEMLPKVSRGDYLEILSAGAYGESMASQYNARRLPLSNAIKA